MLLQRKAKKGLIDKSQLTGREGLWREVMTMANGINVTGRKRWMKLRSTCCPLTATCHLHFIVWCIGGRQLKANAEQKWH